MGWGLYWAKRKHRRKLLCSDFISINSLCIFGHRDYFARNIDGDYWLQVEEAGEEFRFQIDDAEALRAVLKDDGFHVSAKNGTYLIPVEKQTCNGGYFFRCPAIECNRRMRKLYYSKGLFLCRKCLNLGYYSQRISPNDRRF